MRVPTYANYMNMSNAIAQNRNLVDKYSYQSISGLKYQNYSGYGMSAYNIVSMESTLDVTNTFMENNKVANIALNASNLAIETVTNALADFKTALTDLYGMDLGRVSPDYTGGEITLTSGDPNKYVGKTLTVNGTTYTFANDGSAATNINIGGLTTAEAIMQAVEAKVPAAEFKEGKLSFGLYAIDGKSTLLTDDPAKSNLQTGEAHYMTNEQKLSIENVQKLAFSTMQLIADALNTNIGGRYLYGGGSSTSPINFNFSSLDDFQNYFDGVNTIYPASSSAVLSNFAIDATQTGDVSFALNPGTVNEGTITAASGTFTKESMVMNAANAGTVRFDAGANTMQATEYGAFSLLKEGDTIVINGSNEDLGANAQAYIVKSVSGDGRTVTFDASTEVVTTKLVTPDNDVVINKSFPIGSVINLNDFDNKNLAPSATVTGINVDGTQLYVKVDKDRFPTIPSAGNTRWSIASESYYQGGTLEYNQRISESQTISFDVKASDPAFEKIFRALGQIAQGNLVDTENPVETGHQDVLKAKNLVRDALDLIASATSGAGDMKQAKNSSLYSITAKINAEYTILGKVMENQTQAKTNLENNIGTLKDADKNEASVKLILAESALEASYTVLSSVSNLSLLQYMK